MSDNIAEVSDWKPYKVKDFEQFSDEDTAKLRKAVQEKDGTFSVLYQGEAKMEEVAFSPLYTKEDRLSEHPAGSVSTKMNKIMEGEMDAQSAELSAIEKKAYETGFAKGEKDGFNAGKAEAMKAVEHLGKIITEVENLWKTLIQVHEKQIIQLISRAVEKVVYGQIAVDNEIVKRAILNAFEMIPEPVDVTIHLNNTDYEYIENIKEDLFKEIKDLRNVAVVSNPSMPRCGCRIETRSGEVNSSIESRLEAIQKSIVDAV